MAKQGKAAKANRPVHVLRHRSLKVSIWRNQTPKGPFFKVTLIRSYKKEDAWQDTGSFGYDDLMNLAKLLHDAHSWISAELDKESTARRPAPATP